MKYLIILITFVISCTNDPIQEQTYPYRIGTWMVQSSQAADWVGVQQNKSSTIQQVDTIEVQTPQGQYITITTAENVVLFSYIDSTQFNWQQANLDMSLTDFEFPTYAAPYTNERIQIGGWSGGIGGESLYVTLDLYWICGRELQDNQFIWAHFYKSDSTQFRHYRFHVDGFEQAINDIGC